LRWVLQAHVAQALPWRPASQVVQAGKQAGGECLAHIGGQGRVDGRQVGHFVAHDRAEPGPAVDGEAHQLHDGPP